jgi:O-antigen ligase
MIMAYLFMRRQNVISDAFVVVVAGPIVLGYGFANLGLPGPMPVPLTDLLLVVLLVHIAQSDVRRPIRLAPFAASAVLLGIATARLTVDYPLWGANAVRDYTLPLETLFLWVGYWAAERFGVNFLIRVFRGVAMVGCVYLALYPWRTTVASVAPDVGLQHAVPIVGTYNHAGTAGIMLLLFVALFTERRWLRALQATVLFAVLALAQSRGVYIALPMAIAAICGTSARGRRIRRSVTVALTTAGLIALIGFALVPFKGRLGGRVSVTFVANQVSTLNGHSGPGSGSITTRETFMSDTLARVRATRHGWLWGVGLGPDLAGGFTANSANPDVRKPHDDYLEMYARLGCLGLAAFVAVFACSLWRVVAAARARAYCSAAEGRFLAWIIGTVVAFLVIAATQPLLAYPFGTVPVFVLLGAGIAIAEKRTGGTSLHQPALAKP